MLDRQDLIPSQAEAARSSDQAAYMALLEEENTSLRSRLRELEKRVETLQAEIQDRDDTERRLRWELHSARQDPLDDATAEEPASKTDAPPPTSSLLAVLNGEPTPEHALTVVSQLYPERVSVLPSAWKSARRSDSFLHRKKAFDLIWKLATDYWAALSSGKGDAEARAVFGTAYAARESEKVEANPTGRKRRTFAYQGGSVTMMRHLKIGVKEDSMTETLRIHFHWDSKRRCLVIGHCGPHLDFD